MRLFFANPANDPAPEVVLADVHPNLLDISNPAYLQHVTETMAAFRCWQISVGHVLPPPDTLDAAYLRDIHEWLMADVYEEVGATREDELHQQSLHPAYRPVPLPVVRRGARGERIALLPAAQVNARLQELARFLQQENHLMGHERVDFVARLARYYAQYYYAFPFSYGTPHVLQVVARLLGQLAGYTVELAHAQELLAVADATVLAGPGGDTRALQRVLLPVVREDEGEEAALRRKITLQALPARLPD